MKKPEPSTYAVLRDKNGQIRYISEYAMKNFKYIRQGDEVLGRGLTVEEVNALLKLTSVNK